MAAHDRNFIIKTSRNGGAYQVDLFERVQGNEVHIPRTTPIKFDKQGNGHKKTDYYRLKFTIQNGPNCDLEFLRDLENVMWVHDKPGDCPDSPCHMKHTFWTNNVNSNSLKLINTDLKQETLRFTINLVKRGTTSPYIPLDPIVTNGNKGDPDAPLIDYSISSMLVGTATGVIVAVGSVFSLTGMLERDALLYGIGGGLVGLIVGAILGRR